MMFFIYLLGEEDDLLEIFSSMRQYVKLYSVIGIILNGFKIPTDVLLICGIIKVCKHIYLVRLLFAHKKGAIQKAWLKHTFCYQQYCFVWSSAKALLALNLTFYHVSPLLYFDTVTLHSNVIFYCLFLQKHPSELKIWLASHVLIILFYLCLAAANLSFEEYEMYFVCTAFALLCKLINFSGN
jgi:hypothetical protein